MGLIVYVYRDTGGDCTNNGISSRFDQLTLVNVDGPFDPADDRPAAILESHHAGCLRIVPAERVETEGQKPRYARVKSWLMFGGNYAATSDSRFSEACEKLLGHRFYGAVAIHDRIEN